MSHNMTNCRYCFFGMVFYNWNTKINQNLKQKNIMLELFGKNRKSLKEIMREMDEITNEFLNEIISFNEINKEVKSGANENEKWKTEYYTSPNGRFKYVVSTRESSLIDNSIKSNTTITKMKKELNDSIEKQEFEKAAELRDKIKELEKNQDEINSIELELNTAIKNQDFESAIILRDKINKLKV